jgi:signal peptidase I
MKIVINYIFIGLLVTLSFVIGISLLSLTESPKDYSFFVVQSGSMEPTIAKGSLLLVHPEKNYQKRDIITFYTTNSDTPGNSQTVITHRISEIKQTGQKKTITTQGDANNTPDKDTVNNFQVIGKVILWIPFAGYPIGFIKTPIGFTLLIIIPATILVYSEILKLITEIKKLIRKKSITTANQIKTESTKKGGEII